jgi:signal transduction histidine kinase
MERPPGRGRYREKLIVPCACALSLSVLALIVITFATTFRRPFSGFFWVRGTGTISFVFAGTPADEAGLRRGDVMLAVAGEPTRLSIRRSIAAYAAPAVGETLALSVLQGGRVRSLQLRLTSPPLLQRLDSLEILFIAFCLALLGFLVWAYKPYDHTIVLFLLFTHSLATLLAVGWLAMLGQPWAFVWGILCMSLSAAIGLHFHLVFVRPGRWSRSRWPILGLYLCALAPPLAYLPSLRRSSDVDWYFLSLNGARLFAALATALAAGLLLQTYRSASLEEDRRRIRVVVFGSFVAIAPIVGLSILPEVFDPDRPFLFVPYELTLPLLLLIPVVYVAAIQRRLLRLEKLVHRGVVQLVLVASLALIYLALGVGLPRLLPWTDQPLVRGLITVFIALLFAPLRHHLQGFADRLLYGGWYDYGSVLSETTQALAGVLDAGALTGLLTERLARALRLEGAGLLLRVGQGEMAAVEGGGWPGGRASSLPLPPGGGLTLELLRASRPLDTEELTRSLAGVPLTDAERGWLSLLEVRLWVPLVQRGALQGLLVLGAKAGGEPFNPEDRRMLGTLAWSAAVAAENVQLFSALRRRADEVERLYSQLLENREAERKRLARELHDRVIQDLINLHYFLDARPVEDGGGSAQALREGLRGVIDSLRQVCTELRPSALDDLSLGLAIQGYVEEVSLKHGLKVSLRIAQDEGDRLEDLPEEVRLSLFRVLQEALTNVHRHAGARHVFVSLTAGPDEVMLEVIDDGCGFANPGDLGELIHRGHFGLAGAMERMGLVGGKLLVDSSPSGGTCLRASVRRQEPGGAPG